MTPEQQQTAIAKACGWNHWFNGWNKLNDNTPPLLLSEQLPDYLNDLNAMHEAEQSLTPFHKFALVDYLYEVIFGNAETGYINMWPQTIVAKLLSPTASQRAEAFLRTLNLYID